MILDLKSLISLQIMKKSPIDEYNDTIWIHLQSSFLLILNCMSRNFIMHLNAPMILLDTELTYMPLVCVEIWGKVFMLKQRIRL